jgi:hypothetical protein
VSLRPFLASLHRFEQLPGLARELGLDAAWHELAPEPLGRPADRPARAVVVGRRDRFFALGIEAAAPLAEARRIARILAQRGQAALVFGLDRAHRQLAVSVAHADCPSATIDLDRLAVTDLRRLERGRDGADATPAGTAARWAEALAGQALGARFFAAFARMLLRFCDGLPTAIPGRDRHGLALLALTRVLFLYFVQERGWLDGRPRFLREELDGCLGRRRPVDRELLKPLFFGTLNRPAAARTALARRFGRVPFLNGGLFEEHALERRWSAEFDDGLWRDAFDELFERYHFTVGCADDDSAIGPDMLGRVFEGVMDPDERRSAGVFYTPAALVDRIVDVALVQWTAGRLGVEAGAARELLSAPAPEALAVIRSVTVLDPAAGSGAFLLGALRRLVAIRAAAGEARGTAARSVLGGNLFGVDLNPSAVRLAELRLWLEVLDAEPAGDPETVAPLPNLDSFIRQGDSLTEPFQAPVALEAEAAARLTRLRRELLDATGGEKARVLASLRRAELDTARASLAHAIDSVEARIREVAAAAKSPGLFGNREAAPRSVRRALPGLRQERARLRGLARRIDQAGELPWFHYRSQFGDVMAAGGFDLVLGNPPWVRAESLGRARRRELREAYRWFRAGARGSGYGHLPDLSIAFLERGFELLRPGGVLGMLVPAKLLTAGYGRAAREELVRRATLLVADDLSERARTAFDATVYPLALVARRAPPPLGHRIAASLAGPDGEGTAQSSLGAAGWSLRGDRLAGLLGRLASEHPVLGARFTARLGVKTGADRAFLDPPPEVEAELVRPAVRGRDIRAFRIAPAHTLLWTHDERGAPLERLPPGARRQLASHEGRLRRRADYRDGPFWAVFRVEAAISPNRVVWADLARRLEAAVLAGRGLRRAVPLNTAYVVATPDPDSALRLAAWLNTTWLRAVARAAATRAASGFARFNAAVVESVPLPDAVLADPVLLDLGRDAVARQRLDQSAADRRAAVLLGLSSIDRDALRPMA